MAKNKPELPCPHCGHCYSKVVNSRVIKKKRTRRRRRECLGCGERYSTIEIFERL